MSDRGLPTDVRHINGYGSHTYSFINAESERFWVKFHFKTMQGHKHWTNAEAEEIVGKTREFTQDDLFAAIENRRLSALALAACRSCRRPTPARRPTTPSISPRCGRTATIR